VIRAPLRGFKAAHGEGNMDDETKWRILDEARRNIEKPDFEPRDPNAPDVLKAWRASEPRETSRRRGASTEPTEYERSAAVSQSWQSYIDQRIATAIEREHELMLAVIAEFSAEERYAIEGQIKDAKLELLSKMLDNVRDIRKAVEPIVDLPDWRSAKQVN
jgi:hypothetical protein